MTVIQIQRALAQLGFDPGPLDGIMGPRTRAAIRSFQTQQGLTIDGIVGPNTTASLNFELARIGTSTGGGGTGGTGTTPGDDPQDLPGDIGDDDIEPPGGVHVEPPEEAPDADSIVGQTGLSFIDQTHLLLPWLPSELAQIYADAWARTGDGTLAMAETRVSDAYDQFLPGNRRDDGSFVYTEAEYFATIDAYNRTLTQANLNPAVFEHLFPDLVSGEVASREFSARVASAQQEILQNLPAVRSAYANQQGLALTDEAILASFINPEIGEQILNRRITMAQIGGTAALRGFDLGLGSAGRLASAGLNQQSSGQFFSAAARQIPGLNRFAKRFSDPDSDFDLTEFIDANIFGDPVQARRMERLLSQERASFSSSRGDVRRGRRPGQVAGLNTR